MVGVTLRDRINRDVVRNRKGMVTKFKDRVDKRVLRWFGNMVKIDDKRLVMKAEVNE